MKKILIPSLIVLFGFIAMSLTPAKDSVTLRLKPNNGATYTVNTKSTLMNMMEIQGQSMTSIQSNESRQSLTVKEVKENEITFEGKTEAMKMTISQMGMVLTYDSEHPEKTSPMLADQADELGKGLNKPFISKYNSLSKIIENDDHKEDEEASLGKATSALIPLPSEPVSVGSSWTSEKTQSISGTTIKANMTYKVTKITRKRIELEVTGTVEDDNETSGTYSGTASLNPATGMLIKSVIKQNISMTISQQGLTIPLTLSGTTTTTVE